MNICFIVGGDNIFFERMGAYFVKKGHKIHVITLHKPNNKIEGIVYHFLYEIKPKRIFSNLYKYIKIRKFISEKINPDILSAFYITQCGWLGSFIGIHPFILHVMGSDILIAPYKNKLKAPLNSYALRKADVVISESEVIRNEVTRIRKYENNNYVIQFGVDLNLFKPNLGTRELKDKLNIHDEYVIISPRNSSPIYNQDIIIKAFAEICKKRADVILLMKAQNEEFRIKFEKLANEYGILEKTRFYGFVPYEELPIYYNLAKIMISIPSSDSISVCLQEAMACGVVPIISDLPAPKEWVQTNVNGFVIPIDQYILSETILNILINKALDDEIIKFNLKLTETKSDFNKNIDLIESLYSDQNKLIDL